MAETKREFVDRIMEQHGFGGYRRYVAPKAPRNTKPPHEKPLIELTHERFADQGRAAVLALADSKEAR